LALLFGFLAMAIAVLAALSWLQRNQVDDVRSAQVVLNQIAVLTREINNLTLTALQEQNLSPKADTEMLAARHALPKAVLAAHLHAYHTAALEKVWPALDNYTTSAGRQWILMRIGDFDEAKQVDFQEVGPQFDLMQNQVQIAIEAEDKWSQGAALKARNESLVAATLTASAFLILFLRLQRQEHIGQLEVTERTALRESEERFRAHRAGNRHHSYRRSLWPNQVRQSFRSYSSSGGWRQPRRNEHDRPSTSGRFREDHEPGARIGRVWPEPDS
jgi:hypothetical protein